MCALVTEDPTAGAVPDEGAASPRLQDVLDDHLNLGGRHTWECSCSASAQDDWAAHTHAQHQADVWREACTIRTVDQLNALPGRAVVRSADGYIVERRRVELPALLLWHPDWEMPS